MNQPLPTHPAAYPAVAAPDMELRAVQRLGKRTARDGMYVGLILALLGHTAAVSSPDYTMWMTHMVVVKMNRELKAYFSRTEEVEILDQKEKEKENEVEDVAATPDPVAPEPEQIDDPIIPPPAPDAADTPAEDDPYKDDSYDPPPEAAQAQDVMTTDGPVDMTGGGWDIVDSDGSTSRGTGYTSGRGTSKEHVSNRNAKPGGVKGGTGKGPAKPRPRAAPKKDLSQRASTLSSLSSCPFPAQANLNQIDRAIVLISVTVGPNGSAKSASVQSDPGYGFGAQARRCAMGGRYKAAKNRDGRKITQTIVLRFRFQR